jgi:acyl-coenzyme A synthetase/AMP-(fatty) acid ligase
MARELAADFGSVGLIGFAAEPMGVTALTHLRERISPNVVQIYGSTDTGAASTRTTAEEMVGHRLVSIGRPLLNIGATANSGARPMSINP